MQEEILRYLVQTYNPKAVLFMGSYMDGTADKYSDFDCAIVVDNKIRSRDDSIVAGVQLDCDIWSTMEVLSSDPNDFRKLHDAVIIFDDGTGEYLLKKVKWYLESTRISSKEDKDFIRSLYSKNLKRITNNTDDSNYRIISLLWRSLFDYFTLRDMIYLGSKKAIAHIKSNDPEGYILLNDALISKNTNAIVNWLSYVVH